MNLLLDTHIWIWTRAEPWKISSEVKAILADSENELWLSPISIWELLVLTEKKRVALDRGLHEWVEDSKRELFLREAPVSWEIAEALTSTLLRHRDPADRFLVATAKVYELTLVTADEQLMNLPGVRILQNR